MDNLQALMDEIAHLQEAKRLLEKVYVEYGPYREGKPSEQTWREVCNFFKFDDSE